MIASYIERYSIPNKDTYQNPLQEISETLQMSQAQALNQTNAHLAPHHSFQAQTLNAKP